LVPCEAFDESASPALAARANTFVVCRDFRSISRFVEFGGHGAEKQWCNFGFTPTRRLIMRRCWEFAVEKRFIQPESVGTWTRRGRPYAARPIGGGAKKGFTPKPVYV
jgi:hypothetical protein